MSFKGPWLADFALGQDGRTISKTASTYPGSAPDLKSGEPRGYVGKTTHVAM
jgi:hypothetical protein